MADIFISYAKPDRNLAQQIAADLEAQGRTIWWDATIGPDQISRSAIERELECARKVIVLWSTASIASPIVLHEAFAARDASKLVQVKTSNIQSADLTRSLRTLPILDANNFTGIARAVSDREEPPTEPPTLIIPATRELLVRANHDRPDPVTPKSEAAGGCDDRADHLSMSTGNKIFALGALLLAVVDAAVLLHYGLPGGLWGLATRLMAFFK